MAVLTDTSASIAYSANVYDRFKSNIDNAIQVQNFINFTAQFPINKPSPLSATPKPNVEGAHFFIQDATGLVNTFIANICEQPSENTSIRKFWLFSSGENPNKGKEQSQAMYDFYLNFKLPFFQ